MLSKKIHLDTIISELKKRRGQLNAEVRNHADERDRFNQEVKVMIISVKEKKVLRDKYNSLVLELKNKRIILDKELKELRKKDLEAAGYISKKQVPKDKRNDVESEKTKIKRKEQDSVHNSVDEHVSLGNEFHNEMMAISAKVDILRDEANKHHEAFNTVKRESDEVHVEYLKNVKMMHILLKLIKKESKIRDSKEEE